MSLLTEQTIKSGTLIVEVMEKLDRQRGQTLFVLDDDQKVCGSVTDGDIRRGLLTGTDLKAQVDEVMHRGFHFVEDQKIDRQVLAKMRQKGIELVPVLDASGKLLRIERVEKILGRLPIEAVIMAGGEGKRLRPLTETTPKPLLHVGGKTIIGRNIDRLIEAGVQRIYITVNYLKEQLYDFVEEHYAKSGVELVLVEEDRPLGTLGALGLVEQFKEKYVLLMNSDLLTDIDFKKFMELKERNGNQAIVATKPYTVNVPYAVLEMEGNQVLSLKEKPSYSYETNAGIYLFDAALMDQIPKNEYYDAPDFLVNLISQKQSVGSYPIYSYWLDIGRHEEYERAQRDVEKLKL